LATIFVDFPKNFQHKTSIPSIVQCVCIKSTNTNYIITLTLFYNEYDVSSTSRRMQQCPKSGTAWMAKLPCRLTHFKSGTALSTPSGL